MTSREKNGENPHGVATETTQSGRVRGLRFARGGHLDMDMNREILDLREVVSSLINTLSEAIRGESQLTVELTTSINVAKEAETGANAYVFNIGAEVSGGSSGEIKITLETPIFPAESNND